ncbi:MAG: hypothetical protein WC838_05325 [Candidatus Margulisiibacteriota bacterium]|jgi:hypothetical protein
MPLNKKIINAKIMSLSVKRHPDLRRETEEGFRSFMEATKAENTYNRIAAFNEAASSLTQISFKAVIVYSSLDNLSPK